MAADSIDPIQCSAQPLGLSFHPSRNIVATALIDGTVEIHEFQSLAERKTKKTKSKLTEKNSNEDSDDDDDTILASIPIPKNHQSSSSIKKPKLSSKSSSCRSVLFSNNTDDNNNTNVTPSQLFYAGNNGSLGCLDSERACTFSATDNDDTTSKKCLWNIDGAHNHGIHRLYQINNNNIPSLLVSGDDEGVIRFWDTRMTASNDDESIIPKSCVMNCTSNTDYISDFEMDAQSTTLLATSSDGTLSIFDIRKLPSGPPKYKSTSSSSILERRSDPQDDELLSMTLLKRGKKVVCGTQEGVLAIWSWGIWGDISDRFPGHPQSIDAISKVDEDTILTGSSDGLIRLVQIQPDRLLGVLGDHDGFPVEEIQFTANRDFVGSLSHDSLVRLWDASLLLHDDDDDDDDDKESNENTDDTTNVSSKATATRASSSSSSSILPSKSIKTSRQRTESDDEWDDDDDNNNNNDDNDNDSDDSDDDDDNHHGRNAKRTRRLKTDAERFFQDL